MAVTNTSVGGMDNISDSFSFDTSDSGAASDGSGAGSIMGTAAGLVDEFQNRDYGTPQTSGEIVAQGLFQPGRAAGSQIQFFSQKRDERAQKKIDALYDEQERLNEIERKRQEEEASRLRRQNQELDNAAFSYAQRFKSFQQKFQEELDKQRRGMEAVQNIKDRAKRGENIREFNLMGGRQ